MSPQGRKVSFVEPPQVQHLAFSSSSTLARHPSACSGAYSAPRSLACSRFVPQRPLTAAHCGARTPHSSSGAFKARIRIYSPYFPPSRLTIRLTRVPQQFLYFQHLIHFDRCPARPPLLVLVQ